MQPTVWHQQWTAISQEVFSATTRCHVLLRCQQVSRVHQWQTGSASESRKRQRHWLHLLHSSEVIREPGTQLHPESRSTLPATALAPSWHLSKADDASFIHLHQSWECNHPPVLARFEPTQHRICRTWQGNACQHAGPNSLSRLSSPSTWSNPLNPNRSPDDWPVDRRRQRISPPETPSPLSAR